MTCKVLWGDVTVLGVFIVTHKSSARQHVQYPWRVIGAKYGILMVWFVNMVFFFLVAIVGCGFQALWFRLPYEVSGSRSLYVQLVVLGICFFVPPPPLVFLVDDDSFGKFCSSIGNIKYVLPDASGASIGSILVVWVGVESLCVGWSIS